MGASLSLRTFLCCLRLHGLQHYNAQQQQQQFLRTGMLLQSCSFLFVKALVMPSYDHPGEGSIYRSIGIEPTHLQPNRVSLAWFLDRDTSPKATSAFVPNSATTEFQLGACLTHQPQPSEAIHRMITSSREMGKTYPDKTRHNRKIHPPKKGFDS